jgi:hypothetical protein
MMMMQSFWSFLWAALLSGAGWMAKPNGASETPAIDNSAASAVPPPPLSAKLVEQYAYAGGSDGEIAARFLIDEGSLRRRFPDVLRAARAVRHLTLRKQQFDLAREGNATMLTWLGRNELGQSLNPSQRGEAEPELGEKEG